MTVNADQFHAIIVKRNSDMCNQYTLNIDDSQVTSEKSVKPLGINVVTNYLSINTFPHYVKKQVTNLTITQIFGVEGKKILINTFVYANFNYCPLI